MIEEVSPQGSVPVASTLGELPRKGPILEDSNDRPIGPLVEEIEKKKREKGKR